MDKGFLLRLINFAVLCCVFVFPACNSSTPDTPTTTTPTIDSFTGSWRSASTTSAGACTAMSWSITPTGATSATITYSATCAGVPVNGTAAGTLNGSTLNWTTTGAAANGCGYGLNGTATPDLGTDLRVVYGGTVCGVPVSGTEVLRR
jgi:hypothetical protein